MRLLAILFPPFCVACERVEGVVSLPLGLCRNCRGRLATAETGAGRIQMEYPSSLDFLLSRWTYRPPFDAVIQAFKFGRLEFLGRDLADGLHPLVVDRLQEIDLVVPVPLHWMRLRSRGFNQATAIARPLASGLELPLRNALRRRRATISQSSLDRESRRQNLLGAFVARGRSRETIRERRILLVDDVVTTGATLEAAARCLRDHGALSVGAATAGRTPATSAPGSTGSTNQVWKPSLTGMY